MFMIYEISYDLKRSGQDYSGLYKAIKSCGSWWHYLQSTWLVDTDRTAADIWNRLSSHIDENDSILIVNIGSDYQGWLEPKAWEWINERRNRMAA
jgi:hypothetical protein